jgi:hypothetical protein
MGMNGSCDNKLRALKGRNITSDGCSPSHLQLRWPDSHRYDIPPLQGWHEKSKKSKIENSIFDFLLLNFA